MTTDPAPVVLALRGVSVRYGSSEAVRAIDLELRAGEVIGLIGPDGAGKTSTMRVAAGLQRPSAGVAEAFGLDVWRHRRRLHRRIGYLAQRFALYGDLTVDENVSFFARLHGVDSWRTRRDRLLDRVDLARFRHRRADRLSGGMRQKLALACTLIHEPELLLLDEPTTGVDPITRRELWRLLGELVAEGLTLAVATPYLDEAERCSRVALIHEGRLLAAAPPRELARMVPGTVVEVTATPRSVVGAALASIPGVVDLAPFGASFHVRLEGVTQPDVAARAALQTAGAEIAQVRVIEAGLEDTLLFLTRSEGGQRSPGEAA